MLRHLLEGRDGGEVLEIVAAIRIMKFKTGGLCLSVTYREEGWETNQVNRLSGPTVT